MSLRKREEDELLIESIRNGEEQAFDRLFREYFAALTYFANQLIRDSQQAEDIVQDCFVSLWKRRKKLKHIGSIKSYLYTSIRYQCIRFLQKNRPVLSESPATEDPTIEKQIISAETAREIYRLIETLAPGMQQVIRLYYLEGKSYSEISGILGIDPESVRKQKFRALVTLRKTIIPVS